MFERVKFGFANQAENESIDQYVVRLRQLAESCEFENLCESLIRDRLVIGTRDSSTRDRLLRERPVPGLARCIEALRASDHQVYASFVAPNIHMIEPNVLRLVKPVTNVVNKATLP